jgi:signal transduction histidine kinase
VALLLVAWGIDLATPQLFVTAILLNAPVALSGLAFDRRFTIGLVLAALVATATAGWYNGFVEGYHWDIIGIGDRVLSALSILLVGFLTLAAQQSAQHVGELAARRAQAERERRLRHAIEEIRSSVNTEVIYRTAVREAVAIMEADAAFLFAGDGATLTSLTTFCYERGDDDVTLLRERPAAELVSLVQRTFDERNVVPLTRSDPLGRFVLDRLGAARALAAPIADRDRSFGVLVVANAGDDATFGTDAPGLLRAFSDQVAVALAQASLFVQLAEKNEAFARANSELAARSEVIRDLVYALSHDLRTPLTASGMTMRQALDGAYGPLPDAYREILRRSIESNNELQRLAETLLMVARYESGEMSQVRAPVDLAAIARTVATALQPLWESKHIHLDVATGNGEQPFVVLGDESELRRAVTNLVANAVTWTPEGGTVRIVLANAGGRMTLTVADDGYGVPENLRTTLFQRFPGGWSRRGGGTGLGLYIVRRIAENHGGSVRYAPREPNGSTFAIELPSASAQPATPRRGHG